MNSYPSAIRLFSEATRAQVHRDIARRQADKTVRLYPKPANAPGHRRVVIRLWLPLSLLFLLLAPFALLLSPLGYFAPPPYRSRNPILAALIIGRLLMSLGGTEVDVDTPDARVHIRIF